MDQNCQGRNDLVRNSRERNVQVQNFRGRNVLGTKRPVPKVRGETSWSKLSVVKSPGPKCQGLHVQV